MDTQATQNVDWTDLKSTRPFAKSDNRFTLSRNVSQNTAYSILTSNEKVRAYEKLNYQISVVKDQYPTINVNNAPDSLKTQKNYTMLGQVSDDYGLSKLQIVYYEKDKPQTAKRGILNVKKTCMTSLCLRFRASFR
jgi:hypothetical protein